ncbi:MAG TPA: sulfotransferase [Pseudomonadota bacterium]|nr:sulfotransferase [Pseudomonadota bacterium]
MSRDLYEKLRTLPRADATELLLTHLPAWAAELADRPAAAVAPTAAFAEIKAAWQDPTVLADELLPRLHEKLGLWLMPAELAGRTTLRELATYIISEIQPPAPAAGYADPHEGGTWTFKPPAPYPPDTAGEARPTAVFLLGPPRSGTTLLRAMLTGHPALFSPPELNLLPFDTLGAKRQELREAGVDGFHTGLPQAFMHLGRVTYEEAERQVGELEAQNLPMAEVYARLGERAGGRLVVDKSPLYQAHVGWLQRAEQMFAQPKYLFIGRHPYPVLESMVRNRFNRWLQNWFGFWDDNPFLFAEKLWAIYTQNALTFLATIPEARQHWVRYEELVQSPEPVMRRVCSFLGVEFDPAVLNPYQGERMLDGVGDPGLQQRQRIQPELARVQQPKPPQPLHSMTVQVARQLNYDI